MASESEAGGVATEPDPHFERLLSFLKENRGFDFTGYKRASLMRRVGLQMQTVGVASYEDYQDYLELNPDEFTALFDTILINVTSFFRDPDAWAHLTAEILPKLVRDKPTDVLRLWSAGCASGQEAYSLAIALTETLGAEEFRERVKIYATDVDEAALSQARRATYAGRDLTGLSAERVEAFFERSNDSYAFRKDLRHSVIFGRNDLVQDAPISRIDLLACRNTLMYFNAEQQTRILRRLHYALNPHGILFLGKAELLLGHGDMFRPTDLKWRFFEKKTTASRQDDDALPPEEAAAAAGKVARGSSERLRLEALVTAPLADVVIDVEGRLAFFNERADGLFNLAQRDIGRPFQDLEISYRPLELRGHIARALEERRPVWVRDVEWVRPGGENLHFDVHVTPLIAQEMPLGVSVFFSDVTDYRQLQSELEVANRQLETAYEELQSTNEELETTNEELQSTVEELETTNEELQSTNEELETMNEELQSMNDELQSSNEELRERTADVAKLNTFMESIFSSLRRAVAVTDRDLRLLVWNEQAEELWGLRRDEAVGQHLLNLDIGLPVERLRPALRRVLADQAEPGDSAIVLEAVNRRGRAINVRVSASPLRGSHAAVAGAILVIEQLEPAG